MTGSWPKTHRYAGTPFFMSSLGEMAQAVACYSGERHIPADLVELCNMRPDICPRPENSPLENFDVALVGPAMSIEIILDGVHIHRRPIWQLVRTLRQVGPKATRALARWYGKGIAGADPAARREAGAELLAHVNPEWPEADLMIRVLQNAASHAPPIEDRLADLVERLARPVGIVIASADDDQGDRVLRWQVGLRDQIFAAAIRLGLPIFDPTDLIRDLGLGVALESDKRHFSDVLIARVAQPLLDFAFKVRSEA